MGCSLGSVHVALGARVVWGSAARACKRNYLKYPGHFRHARCAGHQNSALPKKHMAHRPDYHIMFSPTNTPGDPNGGRGAEFPRPRTRTSSVVERGGGVHGRALQGVHGQQNSGFRRLLGAMGVLVGKTIHENAPPSRSCRHRNGEF